MPKSVLIVLTHGFEDVEAIAPLDILTRAGVQVTVAGLRPGPVSGAYGSNVNPTTDLDSIGDRLYDAIVFPGGRVNAQGLAADSRVTALIHRHKGAGKLIAAICAAPSHVLGEAAGILKSKKATGDAGFNDRLAAAGAIVTGERVTIDGNIITGDGPGAAMLFALAIAEHLVGRDWVNTHMQKWRIER